MVRPSFFWYDNDSGHKGPFRLMQPTYKWVKLMHSIDLLLILIIEFMPDIIKDNSYFKLISHESAKYQTDGRRDRRGQSYTLNSGTWIIQQDKCPGLTCGINIVKPRFLFKTVDLWSYIMPIDRYSHTL